LVDDPAVSGLTPCPLGPRLVLVRTHSLILILRVICTVAGVVGAPAPLTLSLVAFALPWHQ
jgi:hypothetical protein